MHFAGMEVKAIMRQLLHFSWRVPYGYAPPLEWGTRLCPVDGHPIELCRIWTRALVFGDQSAVHHRKHLPELHRRAAHRSQHDHEPFGELGVARPSRGGRTLIAADDVRRPRRSVPRALAARQRPQLGEPAGSRRAHVVGHEIPWSFTR
jgi:hypothetical protein